MHIIIEVDNYFYITLLIIGHKYTFPRCRTVLVLDGNVKNRRDVCLAKDARYIEFRNLPGSVKTGCQQTPDHKSRYCKSHKHQVCTLSVDPTPDDELSDVSVGPLLRSKKQKSKYPGDPVVEVLVAKRTTRRETYYQVYIFVNEKRQNHYILI